MARSFAGGAATDNINTAFSPSYTTFTVAAWVNVAAYDATLRRLFSTALSAAWRINFDNVKGIEMQVPFSTTAGDWTFATAPGTGVWHHIAFTYDGSNVANNPEYFLDGVDQGAMTVGTAPVGTISALGAVRIGNVNTTLDRCFNGGIAEVAIWNIILSGANITSLAAGSQAINFSPGNLGGYWQLCGVASPEPDGSGNGNAGTVTGTTFATHPVALCGTISEEEFEMAGKMYQPINDVRIFV